MTNLFLLFTNAYLIIHEPCLKWQKVGTFELLTPTRHLTPVQGVGGGLVCSCPGQEDDT